MQNHGVVSYLGSRAVNGRTYWSFALDDVDGYFRTGTVKPKINKGDTITFEYKIAEYDGKSLEADVKSIVVDSPADESASAASPTPSIKSSGNAREEYWDKKAVEDRQRQLVISLQASTNTAIALVSEALKHDMIKMPAQAKRWDFFEELVHSTAEQLFIRFSSAPAIYDRLTAPVTQTTNDEGWDNE